MIKISIHGAGGKMGREIIANLANSGAMLSAAYDKNMQNIFTGFKSMGYEKINQRRG